MTVLVALLALLLAGANGANDVSKGIATLAGSGVIRYRTAVRWGAATTLVGAVASVWISTKLTALFSHGIVSTYPTSRFALAVLLGAAGWVSLATWWRLPVSTTHALVGALLGAGVIADAGGVHWHALITKVARPLLLSAVLAFAITTVFVAIIRTASQLSLAGAADAGAVTLGGSRGGRAANDPAAACPRELGVRRGVRTAHWVSSGAVGAARGLNDTPKLAAVAGLALTPAGMSPRLVAVLVALAMTAGALLVGARVARRLGEGVVQISDGEGLAANLVTAVMVGLGAGRGLPMSTTHVSTGAIIGLSGGRTSRLNSRAVRDFLLAWTATPLIAALLAAAVYPALT